MLCSERTSVNQIMQKDSLSKIWNKQRQLDHVFPQQSVCHTYCRLTADQSKLPGNNCQSVRVDNYNSKDEDFLMFLT